jgi:hypothetical protein
VDNKPVDDLIKQMWDFGNVITAFTVAQSLTVIYFSLEKTAIVKDWLSYAWIAITLILAGAGVYSTAVWVCFRSERRLRQVLNQPAVVLETALVVFRGRIATVLMFNCMAASATAFAAMRA